MTETSERAGRSWFGRLMRRRATAKAGAIYLVMLAVTLVPSVIDVINVARLAPESLSDTLTIVLGGVLYVAVAAGGAGALMWLCLLLFRRVGRRFDGTPSASRGTWLKKEITITFGGVALSFGALSAICLAVFSFVIVWVTLYGAPLASPNIWHWLAVLILLACSMVAYWGLVLLVQFIGRFVFK
jgi:hypothetical protein